uniref:Uncharacterized protein n=1 Tax=Conchiformibius kuhniae TaxID=211502 RepID=A0A8T9MWI4_9NEIS|nr:hypothetical protein LVJ77_05150 [Conchiformibius kuhniae]
MKLFVLLLIPVSVLAAAAWLASAKVGRVSAPYLYDNPADLPEQKTALLLGTVPKLADGRNNLYFDYRIGAVPPSSTVRAKSATSSQAATTAGTATTNPMP